MSQSLPTNAAPADSQNGFHLSLVHSFAAAPNLVFAAWVEKEHTSQWMAPHGFTIPESGADVKPGGAWHCTMVAPNGEPHRLKGVYREMVPGELLSFTHGWLDDSGQAGAETLVTVRFQEVGGKTRLTFEQGPFDSVQSRDSHGGGWSECFQRLEQHLASLPSNKA